VLGSAIDYYSCSFANVSVWGSYKMLILALLFNVNLVRWMCRIDICHPFPKMCREIADYEF
jgi:hypothetical protein